MKSKNTVIDYTRYYKKFHSDNPMQVKHMTTYFKIILKDLIPLNKDATILDVGCGSGLAMLAIKELGYTNIKGIDIDSGQVESCLKKNLDVIQVDDPIDFLQKSQEKYDLILALDVIEHISRDEQLLFTKAIYSSLKSLGRLVCTVPNANSVMAARWRYNDWTHYYSFTEDSLDFLLFNAGFVNIKVSEIEIEKNVFFHPPQLSDIFVYPYFYKAYFDEFIRWVLLQFFRRCRRLEVIAELGWEAGRHIPLSLNILGTCYKD